MTVLLTGATGFVGLALLERLLADGRSVVAFDKRPLPAALLPRFAALPGTLTALQGDVLNPAEVAAALGTYKVTRVIHAAAITSATWPGTRTLDQTRETMPLPSISTVVRSMPMKKRP